MAQVQLTLVKEGEVVANLYHQKYCEKAGSCRCTISQVRVLTPRGAKYERKVTAGVLHLGSVGDTATLNELILTFPAVADAIRRGIVEVKVIETEKTKTATELPKRFERFEKKNRNPSEE